MRLHHYDGSFCPRRWYDRKLNRLLKYKPGKLRQYINSTPYGYTRGMAKEILECLEERDAAQARIAALRAKQEQS